MKKIFYSFAMVAIFAFTAQAQGTCQALFTSASGSSGSVVNFTNGSTHNYTGSHISTFYYWDFGDGNNGYGQNPSHTYSQSGAYHVILTMSVIDSANAAGGGTIVCTSTYTDSVGVSGGGGNPSFCNASYVIDSASGNGTVYIWNTSAGGTATGGGIISSSWDFGDGNTSSQPYPTHIYSSSGTYVVCLTIVAFDGVRDTCTSTFCDTLTVDSAGNVYYKNGPGFTLIVNDPATVGVDEELAMTTNIYPNPVSDELTVNVNGRAGQTVSWTVFDLSGAAIRSGNIDMNTSGEIRIDVSTLRKGIYLLNLEIEGQAFNHKLQVR